MELTNTLDEKAFSKLEKPEKPQNTFKEKSLQGVGKEKINSLKNAIVEIDSLIKEREFLSEIISNEVEEIKTEIKNFLMTTTAVDSEGFKERSGLRQKQIEVSELQLNEKVNCWRDVALLKKELRGLQKELSEKEERIAMLQGILD